MEDARAIWERITCPTLLIRGADSRASDPEHDGRASAFHHRHVVTIANAAHWVHHDQLDAFLQVVDAFLTGTGRRGIARDGPAVCQHPMPHRAAWS